MSNSIKIITVGKTKHKFIQAGVDYYANLLKYFCKLSFSIVKEEPPKENYSIKIESQRIQKQLKDNQFKVLLDLDGESLSSENFSREITRWQQLWHQEIVFIIGGCLGVEEIIKQKVDFRLSFSKMTFNHQMIRLFLVEQIYRAFSIKANKQYHK